MVKPWRIPDSCQAIRHPPVADLHDGTRAYGIGSTIVMHQVMRHVLLACASTVAFCSIASADPLAVAATTADEPAPTTYVQGGVLAGVTGEQTVAGASTEVGTRVASVMWIHASFALGSAREILGSTSGSMTQLRMGADLMTCNENGGMCAFAGADLGVQHTQIMESSDSHTHALGVGRVGLDIGGTHLRWRPGIEASLTSNGADGVTLTQSLAYRF